MASGARLFWRRVEDPSELADAMREVLAHLGPALLDVVSAQQELAMPPTIALEQIEGFSLQFAKAVNNGRGSSELVDLAHTNLIR